ncbi:MAG: zinc ribbon domain-containing protein [Methanoregula sp.]
MAPVICPNCGRSTPEGKFCEHCGASLFAPPVYVSPPSPPAPAPKKQSGLTTILIILGATIGIILFIGAIGFIVAYANYQPSTEDKITNTIQPTPVQTSIITSVITPMPIKTSQTYPPTYRSTYTTSYSSWHAGTPSTVQIQNNYYYYYRLDMQQGDMKKISIKTDGSPIDLMVMDSSNFKKYEDAEKNPQSKYTWQSRNQLSIINTEYILTAPFDDTYYFVLDNTNYPSLGAYAKKNVNVGVTFSSYY